MYRKLYGKLCNPTPRSGPHAQGEKQKGKVKWVKILLHFAFFCTFLLHYLLRYTILFVLCPASFLLYCEREGATLGLCANKLQKTKNFNIAPLADFCSAYALV